MEITLRTITAILNQTYKKGEKHLRHVSHRDMSIVLLIHNYGDMNIEIVFITAHYLVRGAP